MANRFISTILGPAFCAGAYVLES